MDDGDLWLWALACSLLGGWRGSGWTLAIPPLGLSRGDRRPGSRVFTKFGLEAAERCVAFVSSRCA